MIYPSVLTTCYHGDYLDSESMMTSENGYPTWSSTFLPFGQEWNPQTTVNHYKFTGKERDGESGLDNFGARYDSSQYGRFMSPDGPLIYQDRNNPQSLNLYSYVRNNPVNGVDPDGHLTIIIPGTWAKSSDWNMDMAMVQAAKVQFNDDDVRILSWPNQNLAFSGITKGAS